MGAALKQAQRSAANTGGGAAYGSRYVDWRWLMRASPRLRKALTDTNEPDRPLQLAFQSIRREKTAHDGNDFMSDEERKYMKFTISF